MATISEWGGVSIVSLPQIAGHPIAGAEIKIKKIFCHKFKKISSFPQKIVVLKKKHLSRKKTFSTKKFVVFKKYFDMKKHGQLCGKCMDRRQKQKR